jgi:ubiquinone/menaquinone biosynthesis C-methylase UbiE
MSHGPHVLTPAYYQRLYTLEQQHGWFRGMRAIGGALLGPVLEDGRTDLSILDAGCGTGSMLTWLGRFQGARVIGADISSDALGFCRERGQDALATASVLDLPFPDRSFDLVISADVLQHLPDPPGDTMALREALRVLRPGGYLYIRTNSAQAGTASFASYRRYAQHNLRARVAAAGFAVERVTYANCLPSLLAIAQRRRRRAHGQAEHTPDHGLRLRMRPAALRWVDDALALHAEAWYLRRTSSRLPFGDSLLLLARRPVSNR